MVKRGQAGNGRQVKPQDRSASFPKILPEKNLVTREELGHIFQCCTLWRFFQNNGQVGSFVVHYSVPSYPLRNPVSHSIHSWSVLLPFPIIRMRFTYFPLPTNARCTRKRLGSMSWRMSAKLIAFWIVFWTILAFLLCENSICTNASSAFKPRI